MARPRLHAGARSVTWSRQLFSALNTRMLPAASDRVPDVCPYAAYAQSAAAVPHATAAPSAARALRRRPARRGRMESAGSAGR